MNSKPGIAKRVIERILVLSANADKRRRVAVTDSPEFHNLTGAIAAYDKAITLLTALQQREEFHAMISQENASGSVQQVS